GAARADDQLAGDVAHHAALGGDVALAVRASIAAGDRCLRVFALAEAAEIAQRALELLEPLEPVARARGRIELLRVLVAARTGPRRRGLEATIARAVLEAEEAGVAEAVQG